MSRENITADQAFARLRDHSRHTGTRLIDVARAIITTHGMLLAVVPEPTTASVEAIDRPRPG